LKKDKLNIHLICIDFPCPLVEELENLNYIVSGTSNGLYIDEKIYADIIIINLISCDQIECDNLLQSVETLNVFPILYIIDESFFFDKMPNNAMYIKKPWCIDELNHMILLLIENHKMIDELKNAKKEKGLILNNLAEHVTFQNTEMKILWANRSAAKSAGLSIDEIIDRNCYEVWFGKDAVCDDCPVKKCMDTGKEEWSEIITKNNRNWEIHGNPVFDDEGNVIGAVEVTLDVTERNRAKKRVEALTVELINSQEEERQRISKDLHDSISQTLMAAKLNLSEYEKQKDKDYSLLRKGIDLVDSSGKELREIYMNLYPSMLNDLGLESAIRWYSDNYLVTGGIVFSMTFESTEEIPDFQKVHFYRIIQECFSNALKYSQASKVTLDFIFNNSENFFVKISDNGKGLRDNIYKKNRGLGISNIMKRAELINSTVIIDTSPNEGFSVNLYAGAYNE